MKTLLDMLDLAISENYDDRIDAANDLKDIIEELKDHKAEDVWYTLQGWAFDKLKDVQQDLIDDGRCPDCGEELENKVETDIGYLDGRPAYQVNEVVGKILPRMWLGRMIEFTSKKPKITFGETVEVTFTAPRAKLEALTNLSDKDFDITVKQHREKRSLDANAYAWVLITAIADELRASKDEIYFDMLKKYGQGELISVKTGIDINGFVKYWEVAGYGKVNGVEFTHYRVYKGSSEYDTKEMAIFIDGIVSEAQALGIDTRTPEELAEMKSLWEQGK